MGVKRRRSPHVHCGSCGTSLFLPYATEGARITCTHCDAEIVVGERRKRARRRPRLGLGMQLGFGRPTAPLRRVAECVVLATLVLLVAWFVADPEPFAHAWDEIHVGVKDSWSHVRSWFGRDLV
jgi:DNA-directed RNA polymerase subunit RPC12/RpoP